MQVTDTLGRPLRSLRISVTDRCNMRCRYCMPEEDYAWLPKPNILHFEEVDRLAGVFLEAGVTKIRLTGGEPLLRRDLPVLVRMLAARRPRLEEIALTTNGLLFAGLARDLRDAGLDRVTISLDTLDAARHREITSRNGHEKVLEAIRTAREVFGSLKLDTVILRGTNDDELVRLLEYAKKAGAEIRFIEYMDVAGASAWSTDQVFSRADMLALFERHYGPIEPIVESTWAPAQRFRLPDGTTFGIIASTTAPFCRTCDRSRLTADGMWFRCLYAESGTDLRSPLRAGASDEDLRELVEAGWRQRDDRGAELRLEMRDRRAYVPVTRLPGDPHLEMHTKGG